jgi:hypothetical protein
VKKLARWIALAVLAAWLIANPAAAATATQHIIAALTHAAGALSTYAARLFG